jgi:hypothetical protein
MNTSLLIKYHNSLSNIPNPGSGKCHPALLGCANLGVLCGIDPPQITADIYRNVPKGSREVTPREVEDTVNRAFHDRNQCIGDSKIAIPFRKREAPLVSSDFAKKVIVMGRHANELDIRNRSPIPIPENQAKHSALLIEKLYRPDEHLFIGEKEEPGRLGINIRSAKEWWTRMHFTLEQPQLIIANPLTGSPGKTRMGKESFRCDNCVSDRRYAVAEFDNMKMKDQVAFWFAIQLPVVCIIHSGNKSLHAWIRVDCKSESEWNTYVEERLFDRILRPIGADTSCKNEARLSRLPGVIRHDTKQWQRLIYLAPEGKSVT